MKRKTAIKKLMTVYDRNTAKLILDIHRCIPGFTNLAVINIWVYLPKEAKKRNYETYSSLH